MRIQISFGMAPTLRKSPSKTRAEPNGQRSIRRPLQGRIPFGRVPFFGNMEGEAPLVESRANALIAFKCCIESNRWADFFDWRPHPAAA